MSSPQNSREAVELRASVRMKSPRAPPRITRMRPGIGGNQALLSSLNLSAEYARTFPRGRSIPGKGSARLLSGSSFLVLRAANKTER